MKSILISSLALAMLASSISAFAGTAPSKDDPPKEEKMSTASSLGSSSPAKANDSMESNVYMKLDQLEQEVHELVLRDKLNQEEKRKADEQEMKRIRQQNKQWNDSLLGIFG